ncbi:hypothetical protein BDN72DRAFT_834027 [Pluteus cervinus]|uniref:Uncharacterized protein n=1 Tax=Pluteus cervinus TaxID=181527 RepID=A0ACD3B8R4_9AGAR|nr:hypothetical protein BDN72DRAFT_834027 [Pluteus cervinus]
MNNNSALRQLMVSQNQFVAGVAEVLHTLVEANANNWQDAPIFVRCNERRLAVGRGKVKAMPGRQALLYIKGKFGMMDKTMRVQVKFFDQEELMEIDLESWEELLPYIENIVMQPL